MFTGKKGSPEEFNYTVLQQKIEKREITEILIENESEASGKYKSSDSKEEKEFKTHIPPASTSRIADSLAAQNVKVEILPEQGSILNVILSFLPLLLFAAFFIFMANRAGGGSKGPFSIGRSKAKLFSPDQHKKVTFQDVAGVEEAKEELVEIIQFLKDPGRFQRLGGHIPKGVLLVGAPGTGKTLLARAVAGEAGVPFFSISGSGFVEMFVGVGASRVRDLFEQGKKHAPSIVFIDELDAVGRHRGTGLGGGHDEREQTLNQLLVEMDGFESEKGVITIAATNRPDVLDPALLRPGRFDREVVVPLPDVRGREAILKVHSQNVPLAEDVDLSIIARGTPGFSGAQLANLINEASLNATKYDRKSVTPSDLEGAKEKVLMGKERKGLVMTEKDKEVIAYHEAGHALVACLTPESDPVHKVTIIPRGMALGLTQTLPSEEKYNYSKQYFEGQIAVLMAGRCAEKIFLNTETTGASNDLAVATEKAWEMATKYGMSDLLGLRTFGKDTEHPFLGKVMATQTGVNASQKKAEQVDEEIDRILREGKEKAEKILNENKETLILLAKELLQKETLNSKEIAEIINNHSLGGPHLGVFYFEWVAPLGRTSLKNYK
ncbi:MAG: ATP-dependent zinc metalloprotease FtsH [Candidatus Yanofskybacteria bacterium]|nr:ATP-dependent zinc metalloprotease FtsH [Candidatus Yanofskybacteria bacterium]